MRVTKRHLLLPLALALALLSGCTTSVDDKRASFKPHEKRSIGAVSVREFIEARRVRMFGGPENVTAQVREGRLWLSFRFAPPAGDAAADHSLEIVECLAVPLDRPGWFLTAAHCVTREPITLVHATEGRARTARATIIWTDERSDLALLRADLGGDVPLSRWSPDPAPRDLVYAGAQRSPSAGVVIRRERAGVEADWIWHDSPVQDGDSGGPILDAEGRLVAIHSASGFDFWRLSRVRRAVRPDLRRLATLIGIHERHERRERRGLIGE